MNVGFLLRRIDCNDGVASHLETLMRGLKAQGVRVVLLTGPIHRRSTASARYDNLAALATEWIELDLPTNRRPVNLRAVRQVSQAIRDHRINLLHLHGVSALPLARLAVGWKNIPIVATAHPSGTSASGPSGMVKRIIQLTKPLLRHLYLPNHAIAISSELQDWFVNDLCMSRSSVTKIFHGVDTGRFRPPSAEEKIQARRFFGLPADAVVCSLVARYEPVKRHDLLIEAMRRIRPMCPEIRALFVGSGDGEKSIRKLIEENHLDDCVKMYGPMDARTAYWASDLLALPSDREGFPLVVIEAMLCGVVPLRSDVSGASDQISEGKTGRIFRKGGAGELADIIVNLYQNPETRRSMSLAAAKFSSERFDALTMSRSTLSVYRIAAIAGGGEYLSEIKQPQD